LHVNQWFAAREAMSTSEEVKKELKALLDSQGELLNLAKDNKDIIIFGMKGGNWCRT
jgi:hypothetical protein